MHYRIDPQNSAAAYMQLYVCLRGDIENGVYPLGTRLPSKRLLAEESGVSVITVEHTYAILCDEGYAEARPRSGYYVIYRRDDFLSAAHTPQKSAVRTPDNVPHTASSGTYPFPALARTMRRVLTEYEEQILIKSPNHGCPPLCGAISSYLTRTLGRSVGAEQIIIGSGAEYLYSLIVQLFRAQNSDRTPVFGLESPSYEKIRRVYEANGAVCDMLKLGPDGIGSDALNRTDAAVLHVTPFRSYPSGITADASKRREYLSWADRRGGYLIEDNYDSELTVSTKNEDTLYALSQKENVLYLNTFSHTIAPSMRVGYLVLPKPLLPVFEEKLGFYSCTVPVFEQYVLAELLESGDFERHINRVRRARRRKREQQKK
ncbi:MAG: PLP-dependent aminotransferase family protein [Eubacteriales bacterium]